MTVLQVYRCASKQLLLHCSIVKQEYLSKTCLVKLNIDFGKQALVYLLGLQCQQAENFNHKF